MRGNLCRKSRAAISAWLGIALSSPFALAAQPAETSPLETLRSCMQANLPEHSLSQQVKLISEDAGGGQQVLRARLYGVKSRRDLVDLMLSVEEPPDLAGARYLLLARENRDDMFVYLPAVDRVRRVIGGMRGQPLWGTDFSYEDIKHLQGVLSDAQAQWLGEVTRGGRSLHQLVLHPEADAESSYSRLELEVDKATCLVSELRFFDEAGLFKRMTSDVEKFTQVDGRWIFGRVTMENLRSNTRSVLELTNVRYDEKLPARLFHPKTFQLPN